MAKPLKLVRTRRAHSRVDAFIPVTIRTDTGALVEGEIEDISIGGAMLRSSRPLTEGERLHIELRFSGLKTVFGSIVEPEHIDDIGMIRAEEIAEVRWKASDVNFGIQFVNPSAKTRRFLKVLVKYFEQIKQDLEEME